jgi:hypothetical protein
MAGSRHEWWAGGSDRTHCFEGASVVRKNARVHLGLQARHSAQKQVDNGLVGQNKLGTTPFIACNWEGERWWATNRAKACTSVSALIGKAGVRHNQFLDQARPMDHKDRRPGSN